MINLYELLNVKPSASPDEIKSAFRRAAIHSHPDRSGDTALFVKIKEAYEILSDSECRAKYDEERLAWMRKIGAIGCNECGQANTITRRPAAGQIIRCAKCKTPFHLNFGEILNAQKQSLVNESARLVDEIGIDLANLAADAVRAGVERLRGRLGLERKSKSKG